MMSGDGSDGRGSDLLNGISWNLPGRNEYNNGVGFDHVTPSKLITKFQVFCLCSCNKLIKGSRGIAPSALTLGTRWTSVVKFTLRPHYPRERTLVRTE